MEENLEKEGAAEKSEEWSDGNERHGQLDWTSAGCRLTWTSGGGDMDHSPTTTP